MLASIGLVGCVGGIESGGGADPLDSPDGDGNDNGDNPAGSDLSEAKALFDTGVFPTIAMKCSTNACHSESATGTTLTRFVANDAARGWQIAVGYTALVGNFATSAAPILTMVKPGTHKSVTYTTDEETKITAWLDKELELRNGQPSQPVTTGVESLSQATERVLSKFAGCMQLTDFTATNMADAWGNLQAQGNQECKNCHNNGGEGFIASDNEPQFYGVVSTKKYYFLQYLTVDLTMGAAMAKVIINKTSFKGVAEGLDPHREHPRFNDEVNEGMTALQAFYDRTMARVNTTPSICEPVTLQNN
ncbi:MAG: hypothetical protein H0T42_31750 [Deltaproteobacteria bacterium]|nr:hypothetical protein [Deltaproteobacteria bacterium]